MLLHSISHLLEACNVGTGDQAWQPLGKLILLGSESLAPLEAVVLGVLHDLVQLCLYLLVRPAETSRVLSHLQPAHRHTTQVGRFTGSVPAWSRSCEARVFKHLDSSLVETHVGSFGDLTASRSQSSFGFLFVHLVLRCRG